MTEKTFIITLREPDGSTGVDYWSFDRWHPEYHIADRFTLEEAKISRLPIGGVWMRDYDYEDQQ